jgi:hypothetical protein
MDEQQPKVKVLSTDSKADFIVYVEWPDSVTKEIHVVLSLAADAGRNQSFCASEKILTFNLTKTEADVAIATEAPMQITVGAACGAAFLASSFSGNPSAILSMVNTLQLLSLIPLMEVSLDLETAGLLKGANPFNLVPSYSEEGLSTAYFSRPYDKAAEYGFDSAGFLYNTAEVVTSLGCTLLAIVVLWFITKVTCCYRNSLNRTFVQFKGSAFASYMQACLIQCQVALMLQLRRLSFDNWVDDVSCLLALAWCCFVVCLTLSLLTPRCASYRLLRPFYDSNNDRRGSSAQPFLFFLYRIVFVSVVCLSSSAVAQLTVCIVCSASVSSIQMLVYLVTVRPYTQLSKLLVEFVNEVVVLMALLTITFNELIVKAELLVVFYVYIGVVTGFSTVVGIFEVIEQKSYTTNPQVSLTL